MTGPRRLSLRELNRTTLARQWLLERRRATPAEAVGALAGLQAQHANSPYVALWSRVRDFAIADLEGALEDRSVVKATVVRATLHLVAATDFHALDAAAAEARMANWTPTAKRAGLDVAELNEALLEYCGEPRTVAEMEAHLEGIAPDSRLAKHVPARVRQPRIGSVRAAVEALGKRIVPMRGPDDRELVDLAGLSVRDGDADAPVRFLARWDSALIGYDVRDRILPDQHRAAVIKKNGDFLPTFLVDGLVAGLWVVDSKGEEAVLTISPFEKLTRAAHRELEAQAEQLVRFVEPEATRHAVTWRPVA